jgi:hypothetical protein
MVQEDYHREFVRTRDYLVEKPPMLAHDEHQGAVSSGTTSPVQLEL